MAQLKSGVKLPPRQTAAILARATARRGTVSRSLDLFGPFGEPVPHAAHGLYVYAGATELFAQPFDVRVDGARGHVGVNLPDVAQQGVASLHAVSAIVQREQELELEGCELHFFAFHPDTVCRTVDAEH